MTFGSEADGIQWIEYRTDPAQGYAISLNETILAGYEEFYRIVNEFHLEFLNPDITAGAKYECRNLLAPQVRAAAELAIIGTNLLHVPAFCNEIQMFDIDVSSLQTPDCSGKPTQPTTITSSSRARPSASSVQSNTAAATGSRK